MMKSRASPFKATQNVAHIQYFRRNLSYIMTQRCALRNIARSGAIIELADCIDPPDAMTLDLPDANTGKIGCIRWGNNFSGFPQRQDLPPDFGF